jgi:hypothetical protein
MYIAYTCNMHRYFLMKKNKLNKKDYLKLSIIGSIVEYLVKNKIGFLKPSRIRIT